MMEPSLTGHWGNRDSDDFRYQIAFDFVAHLSNIMESEGIGRAELAQKLGVSKGRVSQILNNPGNLTLKIVVEYARAIGYNVAIVTYANSGSGPVHPQIFTTCWEKAGRPTDFFQAEIAVASTGDPVDESYARNLRLERLERHLAAGRTGNGADPWRGKMLVVRDLKRSGEDENAGTDAA
jgi:transcriptional regulator with XRE-family HTH domain